MLGRGKFWVTEPSDYLEPRGVGVPGGTEHPARTIMEVFAETVETHPQRPALAAKYISSAGKLQDDWKVWTWRQYYDDCRRFAKSVKFLDISPFKIISIQGFNSPEWFVATSGAILAGCIPAGLYQTSSPEACHYIADHSKPAILCVDTNEQLMKYIEYPLTDHFKAIVMWGEPIDTKVLQLLHSPVPAHSWDEFLQLGDSVSDESFEQSCRLANIMPGNCAVLVYTSGLMLA